MHNELKSMLIDSQVIWIYDELHRCAIIQLTFKSGRTFYCLMFYTGSEWNCIDINETDIHGAQLMYECFVQCYKMCAPEV